MSRQFTMLLSFLGVSLLSFPCWGSWWQPVYAHVQVESAFIELHTGPGRGFPVFHVVQEGEWVDVIKRRTDWFNIRTMKGKQGWVAREQMETTITEVGEKSQFRDNYLKEFFANRLELGFGSGIFDLDPVLIAQMGYRLNNHLTMEVAYRQVSGTFSSSALYDINILGHPMDDKRLSPFYTLGIGRLKNDPRSTLVQAISTEALIANVGAGLRFYITRNFILRLDYKYFNGLIDDNRDEAFQSYTLGFAFFY